MLETGARNKLTILFYHLNYHNQEKDTDFFFRIEDKVCYIITNKSSWDLRLSCLVITDDILYYYLPKGIVLQKKSHRQDNIILYRTEFLYKNSFSFGIYYLYFKLTKLNDIYYIIQLLYLFTILIEPRWLCGPWIESRRRRESRESGAVKLPFHKTWA